MDNKIPRFDGRQNVVCKKGFYFEYSKTTRCHSRAGGNPEKYLDNTVPRIREEDSLRGYLCNLVTKISFWCILVFS